MKPGVTAQTVAGRLGLDDGYLQGDGIRLHYAGAGDGPLILFLHGFPEFWYSWRHQLREFRRDHRAVALDLRGYNESDKPAGRDAYRMRHIIGDIRGAIEQLGDGRAVLVGHDWGGVAAWLFAHRYPEMLERLIVINAPHPARFRQEIRQPRQMRRSWYIFFFQLPVIPEWVLTRRGAGALVPAYRRLAADPEAITDDDIRQFRDAFLKPGTATAAVNYYRNLFARSSAGSDRRALEVPTLLIWGDRDPYLGIRLSRGLEPYVRDLTVQHISEAGHFAHQERPEIINREIRSFLARSFSGRP